MTLDALGCQKKIARQIPEGGGDYLLTVKENQWHLFDDILSRSVQAGEDDFRGVKYDRYVEEERGHGRREKRYYNVIQDPRESATPRSRRSCL